MLYIRLYIINKFWCCPDPRAHTATGTPLSALRTPASGHRMMTDPRSDFGDTLYRGLYRYARLCSEPIPGISQLRFFGLASGVYPLVYSNTL